MSLALESTQAPVRGASGRSAIEYARALRHSRRVRLLKLIFPIAAAGIILGFIAVSIVARSLPDNVSVARSTIVDGMIIMETPILTGQTDDERPFRVTAARALQGLDRPNVITMQEIAAELPVSDSESARVEAQSGVYDRQAETLVLDQPFDVVATSGLRVEMLSATFDLAEGTMTSDREITISNGNTRVVAQSVRMRDNGRTITFERDVRMTIDPSTLRNTQEDVD